MESKSCFSSLTCFFLQNFFEINVHLDKKGGFPILTAAFSKTKIQVC